jgi:hypothetical protein
LRQRNIKSIFLNNTNIKSNEQLKEMNQIRLIILMKSTQDFRDSNNATAFHYMILRYYNNNFIIEKNALRFIIKKHINIYI